MRNHYYSRKPRKPIRSAKEAFYPASPTFDRMQQVDRVLTSVLKGLLWLGYGVGLISWFVAANGVILFSQMLKIK
jgi:hypothetical protein